MKKNRSLPRHFSHAQETLGDARRSPNSPVSIGQGTAISLIGKGLEMAARQGREKRHGQDYRRSVGGEAHPSALCSINVARFQILRRVEADADTRRRARGNDLAGHERETGRDGLDQRRHVEDEGARVLRVLAQLAIHPATHARVRQVDLVAADRATAPSAEVLAATHHEPLLGRALEVAGGDVVDHAIAPDWRACPPCGCRARPCR